jgi:hypothetical protein
MMKTQIFTNRNSTMSEIFTSYSRRDTAIVDKFVTVLMSAGLKVWIDREDILAGNSWRVQIVEAIDTCDAFVLMLSGNSAISTNVHKEVILAQDSGRAIFVLMLEPVKPPAEIRYQLAGLQFLDFQALGFDKSAAQLISALKEHLKKIKPTDERSQHQTELVIQGIDISAFTAEKQQQLLAFISNLANTDQSQLKIANMTAGSVHVFVDMPSAAAFQLKTMALNRDKRFKEIGVTALKLAGDAYYINIALGILTPTAKISPLNALWLRIPSLFSSTFGLTIGKVLTIFAVLIAITAVGVFALSPTPSQPPSLPTSAPTLAVPTKSTSTQTFTPIPTLTYTATSIPVLTSTLTPTAENTSSPTVTASPTSSPTPVYGFFDGVVVRTNDRIACRYGPGDPYLYEFELISGNKINAYGKMEIQVQKGDTSELWLYGLAQGYETPCWVNSKYIKLNGDVSSLEPYYPDKAPLILFHHPGFPPPKDVKASRDGDQVFISWTGYILALGDRESENSPVYLVEAWTCQGGKSVFTPIGAYQESASVKDEAGCSEPSHGQVFVAHKDGYVGPVEIPWP